ncbi:hypothetical protein [Trinickia sp.]|uniref:hypothetical protein n=1 Tax=Trinickia sp. TaxID=2571163 RepID=UPI003F7D1E5C
MRYSPCLAAALSALPSEGGPAALTHLTSHVCRTVFSEPGRHPANRPMPMLFPLPLSLSRLSLSIEPRHVGLALGAPAPLPCESSEA